MRILLLSTSYNMLTQLIHAHLRERNYDVSVTLSLSDDHVSNAVRSFCPDLIICPFLKERISEDVYSRIPCVIIHPGPVGDRGPSSLDWAIIEQQKEWGVTAIAAAEKFDEGAIWATRTFPMRKAAKSSIYRNEVAAAALLLVDEVIERFAAGGTPTPISEWKGEIKGIAREPMRQEKRAIDWAHDTTDDILRKMNSAESSPGVLDTLLGEERYLYGAHKEAKLRGTTPGSIIGVRNKAICRATVDGALWITHLKNKTPQSIKLPAVTVLADAIKGVPVYPLSLSGEETYETYKEIWYEEKNSVGYLHFDFYSGAMGPDECARLKEAIQTAKIRPIRVLALMGGTEFWSNGMYLHEIEADPDPAERSWQNINAMDDVVKAIATIDTQITISAMYGGAGAGGAVMALAADVVCGRSRGILNPHYRAMGLYGSEYWTYLLPRRVGKRKAIEITHVALPIAAAEAKHIGLIDHVLSDDRAQFLSQVSTIAESIASAHDFDERLAQKKSARAGDEATKPLESYRAEELEQMKKNFSGQSFGGVSYDKYRERFVRKLRPEKIPVNLI